MKSQRIPLRLAAFFFLIFATLALAVDPTQFCKCSCGDESTIIPLNGDKAATCLDCNRQFCLSYNLPICKDVKEVDIVTTCFQRDSLKDQAVVIIFIMATGGLLIYAAARPWLSRWMVTRDRDAYTSLPSES